MCLLDIGQRMIVLNRFPSEAGLLALPISYIPRPRSRWQHSSFTMLGNISSRATAIPFIPISLNICCGNGTFTSHHGGSWDIYENGHVPKSGLPGSQLGHRAKSRCERPIILKAFNINREKICHMHIINNVNYSVPLSHF